MRPQKARSAGLKERPPPARNTSRDSPLWAPAGGRHPPAQLRFSRIARMQGSQRGPRKRRRANSWGRRVLAPQRRGRAPTSFRALRRRRRLPVPRLAQPLLRGAPTRAHATAAAVAARARCGRLMLWVARPPCRRRDSDPQLPRGGRGLAARVARRRGVARGPRGDEPGGFRRRARIHGARPRPRHQGHRGDAAAVPRRLQGSRRAWGRQRGGGGSWRMVAQATLLHKPSGEDTLPPPGVGPTWLAPRQIRRHRSDFGLGSVDSGPSLAEVGRNTCNAQQ